MFQLTTTVSKAELFSQLLSAPCPDIAVIGMACRVAGSNNTPEKLWDFLMQGKHGSGEIDPLRWEAYRARDSRNTKELNKTTSRGYFVDGIEDFDNMFFGISPKEAEMMDPQQRISLEVCWEALENAGIAPQTLAESNTAVFMGVNSDDYGKLLLEDLPGIEAWMGIGTAYCGIPNRISYHLNLMGPSTAVDAACASSLVAIHHGRQSLLLNETNLAIVGGVNALYGPGLTKVLDKAGATSSEGICRSFDDASSGYGRGEGAGIVILKRLDDAVRDQDNIISVLKGSAVGQDGKTNGIMAPNGKAQELVAKKALNAAGLDPLSVGYVEAHATSTPVGDPVEVNALANVYGRGRRADAPCLIGSIKPNIGHLEAGAGVMGFMKASMAVSSGIIPPQANLEKLNSRINWKEAGVQVVQKSTAWKNSSNIRRAAISSYGYGGTVSHAVIEQYNNNAESFPAPGALTDLSPAELTIVAFSSPQEKCLASQAMALSSWLLADGANKSLSSIATTLATRRSHHDYRAAVVAGSHEEAAKALKAFAEDSDESEAISSRIVRDNTDTGTVWVFSGHGAHWKEMGQTLLDNPIFYEAILPAVPIVQAEAGFSLLQALKDGDIESTDKVQILTYVMQIGLTAVLKSNGVFPQAIIGHSVGEIAASVAAGALTVHEGAFIVSRRATLYRRVMGQGAMILVNEPFEEAQKELCDRGEVVVAIDASPSSCVVSGTAKVVNELAESLKARNVKVAKVKTDIAFHSPTLAGLVEPLTEGLVRKLKPKPPSVRLYSTSLTDPRGQNPRDAHYWTENMVGPVLLRQAVSAAAEDGFKVFLEVSTHPIIVQSIEETLIGAGVEEPAVIPTMNRGKQADRSILTAIAHVHCAGMPISWKSQRPMSGEWARNVPTTTWNHQRYLKIVETGLQAGNLQHDCDSHSLLGQRIQLQEDNSTVYITKLSERTRPFPGKHPLHGTEIIPAAVLINTFYHATEKRDLYDIVLRVPVALSVPRDVQVTTYQGQVKLVSQLVASEGDASQDQSWLTHTTGHYADKDAPSADDAMDSNIDVTAIKRRVGSQLKNTFSIDYLAEVGVSEMGFPVCLLSSSSVPLNFSFATSLWFRFKSYMTTLRCLCALLLP